MKSSLEAPWKRWWNDDSIFSWVKQSPPEQNSLKNGARTFRNKKLLKKTSSAKDESFISLPSQYLNGSYVNVGKDSIVDELPLDGGPATKPIIEAPKRSGPFGKTIRKVRSRPDLKAYKNDSAPSPTPEPIIHEAQAKPKHSLVRKQKIIGLGISGIHIPDFSATEDPEVTQTSPGNRLDDHPPRLPEISVSVSFSEGESVCWSFQSSPVSDSLGSAAFSHLSCSSEYENLKEERDTAGLVEPSMPASTSSYEHMRSIVKPLLNEDDYSSTLSPLIDGDLSLVSARFSIDEPKSFLKDFVSLFCLQRIYSIHNPVSLSSLDLFKISILTKLQQKNLFSRTQRSNTNFQKIKKNDNIDIAFSTYPLQPQYQAHGYNSQRHPNHIFPWTTYNIWCYHCTKKTCSRCGNRCCFLTQLLDIAFPGCPMVPKSRPTLSSSSSSFSSSSIFSTPLPSTPSPASPTSPTALDGLAKPKAATSPDAKKQAMKAIREIVALYPAGGKDALDMFLRCTSCERTVCSMCCGVCPEELCGDLQCKDCKTDPWARCDWHW